MIYKDFKGKSISLLGMGNMRLPVTDGRVDKAKAQEIIDYVYAGGVNYFDTAYMYHQGESERFLGEALTKYPRDSYYLADKMPGFMLAQGQTPQSVFEEQLSRCKADYFDFYLLHNVNDSSINIYNDEKLGIINYLLEEKKKGRIKHFGFSCHGKPATLKAFLDKWDCFEFVQIQLNYLDWELQDAKKQYEIITSHGIPVWVMEPVRGGRLASLNPEADALLLKERPEASIASWAFRYLMGLDNVQVILSGMTTLEQAQDNVKTFSKLEPLGEDEQLVLKKALHILKKADSIPCTKCNYCEGCPMKLDFPGLFEIYNELSIAPGFGVMMAINGIPEDRKPDKCISCGQCVLKCPHSIDIPGYMQKFTKKLMDMPRGPRP
jgi:predicted aldo/keto reductase-like oxidoreductase